MKDYLRGRCHEYAVLLKQKDDTLKIECVVIPRLSTVIHVYCVTTKGKYVDCRGVFDTQAELMKAFDGYRHGETLQFNTIEELKVYLNKFFKDGITEYDEELDEFVVYPFIF